MSNETMAPVPKFKTFAPFADDELEALDIAHDDIRVVRGATPAAKRYRPNETPEPPWEVVFRRGTKGEIEFFERQAMKDGNKDAAYRNLAKATVVGVSLDGKHTITVDRNDRRAVDGVRAAWESLRDKFGGAHLAAVDDLNALAGMVRDESGKD